MSRLTAAVLLLAAGPAHAQSFPVLWKGWERVGTNDGITIFKREVAGSSLLDFGGETVLDASVEQLCSILVAVKRYPEWVDSLDRVELLERRGPRGLVYYTAYTLPWPIADRDFVTEQQLVVEQDTQVVRVTERSVAHPKRPDDDCCTRASMGFGEIRMRALGPNKTAVAAVARVDLKGMLPSWLVNFVQEEFPLNTFVGYRKQLARVGPVAPACQGLLDVKTSTSTAAP